MNSLLIFLIIALYFSVLLIISHIIGKRHSNNEAFFIGNRQSPWYVVAIGMIGTSISGVTFVSVPGQVRAIDMTYVQMTLGFFFGYMFIAHVLLPLYYKLNLTSIYTYLQDRIGIKAYKTGSFFFILSKLLGAAARLYIVILIMQLYIFDHWGIPFYLTVTIIVALIFLYTFRSGIRTIIWTDMLQTLFLLTALVLIIWQVTAKLDLNFSQTISVVTSNEHFHIFEFGDINHRQNFFKQFISGIFIVIVMTGLDQEMMQKNISCRNLKEAQKNIYSYSWTFVPINFLFLCLGILLLVFTNTYHIELPSDPDQILPVLAASGMLGTTVIIFFIIGLMSATFPSADSALTSLTTSFCFDFLNISKQTPQAAKKTRLKTHIAFSVLFIFTILIFNTVNNKSIIDVIYIMVSYSYGPLLGMYAFGLFTKIKPKDSWIPYICILSPILSYTFDRTISIWTEYKISYELLILNGLITFLGMWFSSKFVKNP
ncbi:MAG: sodium:solute symporter [Candidatus Azobacteroides sp.]|nr:sodium:solute symporter [Candidatus Azobacteroides sp.]